MRLWTQDFSWVITLAKASLVGAKMVMALAPLTVSTRPASVTAVTRVENLER